MSRAAVRLVVSVCAVLAISASAFAKTVKVDPDPTGTPIADAVAQLEDGDKLILNAGTYAERLTLFELNKIKVIGKGEVVFDGVGPSATISVRSCDKVRIQGISIVNAPSQGLLILDSTNVAVKACVVEDHVTQGLQVSASTRISILKSTFSGGTNGIQVLGDSTVNISGNTVMGTSQEGIFQLLSTLPGNVIRKNTVDGAGNAGIAFEGAGNKVEKNLVTDCLFGIVTPFAGGDMSGSRVQKNKVMGGAVALRTYALGTLLIAKNTVDGASSSGLQVAKKAGGNTITKNKFMNVPNGLDDESDTGVTVSKNKAINTENYGFRARGAGASSFEKNTVNDTSGDGFAIWTGGHTFTKNKANGNAGLDLESGRVPEGDNTFVKNKFGTTTFDSN